MQSKKNLLLIIGFILIGVFGISALVENIIWYRNLNGYLTESAFYMSGMIKPPKFIEKYPDPYEMEEWQIVLARVIGKPGNYKWAYRYSLIPGVFPTWPFVKTIITDKNMVPEYLHKSFLNPSLIFIDDPIEALDKSKKEKIPFSEIFPLMDHLVIGFWVMLILGFLYCEVILFKKLIFAFNLE